MSSQDIIKASLVFVLYLTLQVLFARNLVLFDVAFCFIYLVIILWLPGETDTLWVILISFAIGLFVDLFYNTAGVHAAACTLIGFLRKSILKSFFPSRGIENEINVRLAQLGHQRYLAYIAAMTFIHHLALFFIEAGGTHLFLNTLLKIFSSLLFTVLVIYLLSVFVTNLSREKQ
ncbi:hypothetical protein [Jiulongibacter sediminis]|uniref:Rod shape-determining protein MreD n=1 Tax=Jiulongibacter sediminis TaxID=1605367 RepID=A0A0P7BCZ0_9BACT|nr:hypothetical protein [Jiulongibacter sediminis]KPM48512.1 hypothetical protein AFM12_07765 [Jiulongibacter sediminis]TBX25050.1 hypothetical protein TK44_07770 [Jiulongibacter sediminis]